MDLIYLTDSFPYGKTEGFLIPEVRELLERGHALHIVPVKPVAADHVVHDRIEDLLSLSWHERLLSGPVMLGALAQFARHPLRSSRVVSVIRRSRSLSVALKNIAVLPKALWLARLLQQQPVDHIHAHWSAHTATVGMLASQLAGTPWSFTAHRWDIAENNLLHDKVASAHFSRAIDVNGAAELANNAGVAADDIVVIHMGVDIPGSATPPSQSADDDPTDDSFRFVVAANLDPKKGHGYLLDAVAELRRQGVALRLDILGDGELDGELRRRVADLGLSADVTFRGWIPHSEMQERMRRGEWGAMVLASVITWDGHTEGIPVSLVEAMAASLPTVSTRIGGIPELLGDGAGFLVEPGDSLALAAAMRRVATEPELRASLRVNGLRRVQESFAIGAVVSALETRFRQPTTAR